MLLIPEQNFHYSFNNGFNESNAEMQVGLWTIGLAYIGIQVNFFHQWNVWLQQFISKTIQKTGKPQPAHKCTPEYKDLFDYDAPGHLADLDFSQGFEADGIDDRDRV